ncbi:hypothetical protein, partial [Streptomyces longwoodensis]|uniref:hypothetical protein n=1 Tax=Streptomyces longwoodensis TaxID=68231 RepID=UPI0033FE2D4E
MTFRLVQVGKPGNPSVGIKPFKPGFYKDCKSAPSGKPDCQAVGAVDHTYMIGEVETTVDQYVTFLNTVDPNGTNQYKLWVSYMSSSAWPKYGPINFSHSAASGKHYSIAYPQWANKPIGFVDFISAAHFINSMDNGRILSHSQSQSDGFTVTTYTVKLSPNSETGMYDLRNPKTTRTKTSGFVIPSQDEWIKAAYYDPKGGGKYSYWEYPTGPFDAPKATLLNSSNGDVKNSATQPIAAYSPQGPEFPNGPKGGAKPGTYPEWCPPQAGSDCQTKNPLHLPADKFTANYQASLETVGQALTRSPWGTLDQAGNAVEWTDTIDPILKHTPRVVRRMHGGVSNAKAYQLKIAAIGPQPQSRRLKHSYQKNWYAYAMIAPVVVVLGVLVIY